MAEMYSLPVQLFHKLVIFDTYLEPQDPAFRDLQVASLKYEMTLNNPNMTEKYFKKIDPERFRLINPNKTRFKSPEELMQELAKKEEQKQAAVMSMFDPALVEQLKRAQK